MDGGNLRAYRYSYLITLLSLAGTGSSLSPGHGRYFCGAKVSKTLSLIFVASLIDSAWASVYRRNKNDATLLFMQAAAVIVEFVNLVTS